MDIDDETEDFIQSCEELNLIAGSDEDGYNIRICKDMDTDELTDILCYIIKTAIGSMDDAKDMNEMAEAEILRLLEQKIIDDDAPYLNENE
jgi:hypothetical protein